MFTNPCSRILHSMSDIDKLARATKNSFDKVDKQFAEVRHDMKAMESRLNKRIEGLDKKIGQSQKEIIHEFKALAENIHQDVVGVNKDEISLIQDNQNKLDIRVARVERRVGV